MWYVKKMYFLGNIWKIPLKCWSHPWIHSWVSEQDMWALRMKVCIHLSPSLQLKTFTIICCSTLTNLPLVFQAQMPSSSTALLQVIPRATLASLRRVSSKPRRPWTGKHNPSIIWWSLLMTWLHHLLSALPALLRCLSFSWMSMTARQLSPPRRWPTFRRIHQ